MTQKEIICHLSFGKHRAKMSVPSLSGDGSRRLLAEIASLIHPLMRMVLTLFAINSDESFRCDMPAARLVDWTDQPPGAI